MKYFLLFFLLITTTICNAQTDVVTPEQLAQAQFDAYNNRDIDAFLAPYADDVEVYRFPNQLNFKGKENMRPVYTKMFNDLPDLHCKLVNRIVEGDTVIDHESVTLSKDKAPFKAIAIYKIKEGKIAQVYIIQ